MKQRSQAGPDGDNKNDQYDREETNFVYMSWINMWCGTFNYQ